MALNLGLYRIRILGLSTDTLMRTGSTMTLKRLADALTMNRRSLAEATGALAVAGIAHSTFANQVAAENASPQASPAATPAASPVANATPDPNSPFTVVSPTREEALAKATATTTFDTPTSTGGDLIEVATGDIATLNPVLRQDGNSFQITVKIWENLVASNPIDGAFVPQLADSWEMSSDGMRWRFHLNPEATWHDGKPVTADDVIYSFTASTDATSLAPNLATIDAVLASFNKVDDHMIELIAKFPSSSFLFQTATLVPIVPKHIWESIPFKDWGTAPASTGADASKVIGSGPFRFVEWVQNDHVTLARNENYWLKEWTPAVDRYIYQVVADTASSVQSLTTGEADISGLAPSQAVTMKKDHPDFKVNAVYAAAFWFYMTNLDAAHTELFSDVRVRQALYYGIDRKLLVDTVYLGYAKIADSYAQVPASPGYAPDQMKTVYTLDVKKAKQLLDEAGWTAGTDGKRVKQGKPFSFEIMYDSTEPTDQQLIPYFQQAWGDLGIDVQAKPLPFPSIIEAVNARDYHMIHSGFGYFAPDGNTGLLFRTDAAYPAGYNMAFYSNPKYDQLDDEQLRELDPSKRKELLIEQSNILNEDLPWAPLTYIHVINATHPRVHNYVATGVASWWSILKVWVDKSKS